MIGSRRTLALAGAIAALTCPWSAPAAEAPGGIAYDTVWKVILTDKPPLRSEDFKVDFRSNPEPSSCNVPILRRYMTMQRERIDDVCKREATIIDCIDRTVTSLALDAKTYTVVSLDMPYDDGIAEIAAHVKRSGLKSKLVITRAALGQRKVGGYVTDVYRRNDRQTTVSDLFTITTQETWTYYFLPTLLPRLTCTDVAAPWLSRYGSPGRYDPGFRSYFDARSAAIAMASGSQRSESGANLPPLRIALFSVGERFQRQTGVNDFNYFFEIESGNIRPIPSDDPAFTVPSEFTKQSTATR